MPVIQQPGFWDYLGQALGGVGGTMMDFQKQQQEKERQHVSMISSQYAQGLIPRDVANNDPIIKKMGISFAETPTELQRRITANPGGDPSQKVPMPDLSKYILPTPGLGTVPAPIPTTPTPRPWTDDERRRAGLPTADEVANTTFTGMKAREGIQYFKTATPDQKATALGLPTASKLQLDRQKELEPVLTNNAARHVDELVASSNIDTSNPKALRANSTAIIGQAYQNWLNEAQASGSLSSMTPEDRVYAKSFFASAYAEKIKDAEKYQQRMNEIRAGREGQNDKSIATATLLQRMSESTSKQLEDLQKNATNPVWLYENKLTPQDVQAAIKELRTKSNAFTAGAVKALNNKISSDELGRLLGAANVEGLPTNAVTVTGQGSLPPAGRTVNLQAVLKGIVDNNNTGDQTLANAKKHLLDAGLISPEEYKMLEAAVKQELAKKGNML